jgi:hypothetical protein
MAQINLDQAGLQALIQNAVQQALLAAQQQQQQQPPPPPPPVPAFALVPGEGPATQPWDFTKGDGLKLFLNGTKGLDIKYDGSQEKLTAFLEQVSNRAASFGWTPILTVNDTNGTARDVIAEYGTLTHANVLANTNTYIRLNGRNRQASNCLQLFLKASIESEVLLELAAKRSEYTVTVNNEERTDGVLMLYKLISMVVIETRTTISNIMERLTNLNKEMDNAKGNVKEFNKVVNQLLTDLRARNAPVPELLTQLFPAYKGCGDEAFAEYIKRKQENYEDRTLEVTQQQLMRMALEKYKNLVNKGEWMKMSSQQLEFIAMKAELQTTLNSLNKKTPTLKQNDNKTPTKKPGRRNTGKYAWKGVAPKPSEPQRKKVDGKWYIHCPHHGETKWVLEINREGVEHKTGCRAKDKAAPATPVTLASTLSSLTPGTISEDTMTYARALAAVMINEQSGSADHNEADEDDE